MRPLWTYEVQRALSFRKLVSVAIFRERMAILAEAIVRTMNLSNLNYNNGSSRQPLPTSSTKEASKITKTAENSREPRPAQGSRTWRLSLEVAQLLAAAKSIFRISIMWYKTITQ